MSDQTHADLEQAIAAHVADEYCSSYVHPTGWVLEVAVQNLEATDEDRRHDYLIETPRGQAPHVTTGLLMEARDYTSSQAYGDDGEDG